MDVLELIEQLKIADKVTLFIRHAERYELPPDSIGERIPLTECGKSAARHLGELLRGLNPRFLSAAETLRCRQTVFRIYYGAYPTETIAHYTGAPVLGSFSPFLRGDTSPAAADFVEGLTTRYDGHFLVAITHDVNIREFARIHNVTLHSATCPDFLEGIVIIYKGKEARYEPFYEPALA